MKGILKKSTNENGQSIREFHKGYTQIVQDLKRDFLEPQNLETLQEKKAFIKAYNELLRIENILSVFDEFSEDKVLLDERTKQNLQSAYLQIKDELMGQKNPQLQAEIEDLVFEIELIRQVDINIDFIYELLQSAKKESDKDKREKILQDIARWVDSSLKLRDKGDLIKEFSRYFIDLADDKSEDEFSFIEREFRAFVKIKKKQELEKIIADEGLNAPKTMKFIEKSFKNGEISDLGVDFREILPKSSLFAAKNTQQNERVFSLLKGFYEKYRDISGSQI